MKFLGQPHSQLQIGRALQKLTALKSTGRIFFVKKSTDVDYKDAQNLLEPGSIYNTIQAAINACTTALGDTVAVFPGDYTEALTLSKNNVNIIGLGGTPRAVKIAGNASTALTLTGDECSVENVQFFNSGAAVVSISCTGVDGFSVKDCEFDTDLTSSAAIIASGADNKNIKIEKSMFTIASAGARAVGAAGGAGNRALGCVCDGGSATETHAFNCNIDGATKSAT